MLTVDRGEGGREASGALMTWQSVRGPMGPLRLWASCGRWCGVVRSLRWLSECRRMSVPLGGGVRLGVGVCRVTVVGCRVAVGRRAWGCRGVPSVSFGVVGGCGQRAGDATSHCFDL